MKLVHLLLEKHMEFRDEEVNLLLVEEKTFCVRLIDEMIRQSEGGEGEFVLSYNGKEIKFKNNVFVVSDFFRIDLNDKKIITGLYKALSQISNTDVYLDELSHIQTSIFKHISNLEDSIGLELNYESEVDLTLLFKSAGVTIETHDMSFEEKLLEYMKLLVELLGTKLIVLVNLSAFLSEDKLNILLKDVIYEKYDVLLIESEDINVSNNKVNRYIIDNDLCEI